MRNRRRDRPTSEEVDQAKFSNSTKRHYSQDMMRRVEMGRRSFAKGEDARQICLRLFRSDSSDLIKLITNHE